MNLEQLFEQNKEQSIHGRYITLDDITPLLENEKLKNDVYTVGESVLGKPIYGYKKGEGKTKIYLWSQMHGNESTTTKALFDFINVLNNKSEFATKLLNTFTFYCIPMLNPDGAKLYTRANANSIDLNRDSQDLSQPESRILRDIYEEFQPDFCYNLHDQRTIFGVADSGKPATLSFLAPSYNEAREINSNRLKAINLIAGINEELQKYIPGQVGRFDDSFNINCIGDTFQYLGTPTILFEAGHYPDDYEREITRKFVFMSLVSSFVILSENDIVCNRNDKYLNIPQNNVVFFDFMYKNVKINYDGNEIITNFVAQYKEELIDGKLKFNAYIAKVGDLDGCFGHFEYDAKESLFQDNLNNVPFEGQLADFNFDKNVFFVNGKIKK
ncbi:M14 family metallopeptidase [Flavobacterium adhaerens]|uniref:M14 family metallopeptidase n=1 Tax=Flavobacterium adhaerens TaxID=3149043 RepID=UPI0032B3922E